MLSRVRAATTGHYVLWDTVDERIASPVSLERMEVINFTMPVELSRVSEAFGMEVIANKVAYIDNSTNTKQR